MPPAVFKPAFARPAPVKVALVGAGSLGTEHARIYADLAAEGQVEFAGIFDLVADAAEKLASRYRVPVLKSLEEAASRASALSLVTPTATHYELAMQFLALGKHLLVEKPMTDRADQAAGMVRLAKEQRCVLQVGHVERFNPVFTYLKSVASDPRFIETHRLSPYSARSTDIGVVLDLMIHDLDIVLAFVGSAVASVDAVGIPVLSASEDIANARLRFANGCVANLTASRISPERMRKIRVFSGAPSPSYVSLDYRMQEGYLYRIARPEEPESSVFRKLLYAKDATIVSEFGGKRIVREPVPLAKEEPLRLELESFVRCVQAHGAPVVSGEAATRALDLAFEITAQIQRGR